MLLPLVLKLFESAEPELRGASISQLRVLHEASALDPSDIADRVLPALKNAGSDSEQSVRVALASVLLLLSSDLNKHVVADQVVPKFLVLLKDEVPAVRLELFRHIGLMAKCIAPDVLMQSTLPSLCELAANAHWRVRASAIDISLSFAELFNRQARETLCKLVFEWSTDKVSAIRYRAVEAVLELFGREVDKDWLEADLVRPILEFSKIKNYLHRLTCLALIQRVFPLFSVETKKKCWSVLAELAKDPVPNVRMNVCRTL